MIRRPIIRAALIALSLPACAPEIDMRYVADPPPGADVAEQLILSKYGCEKATVYWYGPAAMTCPGGQEFHSPVSGKCVRATSWGTGVLVVGYAFEGQPVWLTELVHEYGHRTVGDGGHLRRDWWGDYNAGKPGGIVEDTRAMVRAALCALDEFRYRTVCVVP